MVPVSTDSSGENTWQIASGGRHTMRSSVRYSHCRSKVNNCEVPDPTLARTTAAMSPFSMPSSTNRSNASCA
jgi:hypothetical protein